MHSDRRDSGDFSAEGNLDPALEEYAASLNPELEEGHGLPADSMQEWDDFDAWAERAIRASGFGVAALDID